MIKKNFKFGICIFNVLNKSTTCYIYINNINLKKFQKINVEINLYYSLNLLLKKVYVIE